MVTLLRSSARVMRSPIGLISVLSLGLLGATNKYVEKFIEEQAQVLDEDKVFYRWQSTASGENLTKAGQMTADLNAYFMSHGGAGGPGIYMAGSELSSSQFLPPEGGNLIEIRIPKGARVLDLTDSAVKKQIPGNLNHFSILTDASPPDGIIIRYGRDWYVGKNLDQRTTFRTYPGLEHTPEGIMNTLDEALRYHDEPVVTQLARQVRVHRPDAAAAFGRREKIHPSMFELLPPERVAEILDRALQKGDSSSVRQTLDVLKDSPSAARLLLERPALTARAAAAFASLDLSIMSPKHIEFLRDFAAGAPETEARTLLLNLIHHQLADPRLAQDWKSLSKNIDPLLARIKLTADERKWMERAFDISMTHAHVNIDRSAELRQTLALAGLQESALATQLKNFEVTAARILHASRDRSIENIQAALSDLPDMASFNAVYQQLDTKYVPSRRLEYAFAQLLENDHARFTRLLRTPADFREAVTFFDRNPEPFARTYAAALEADPLSRSEFIVQCLRSEHRDELLSYIQRDDGKLFTKLADFESIGQALRLHSHGDSKQAQAAFDVILKRIDQGDRLAAFARGLSVNGEDPQTAGRLIARAREIGFERFRARDLVALPGPRAPVEKEILREIARASARSVVNANDAVSAAATAKTWGVTDTTILKALEDAYARTRTRFDDPMLARDAGLRVPLFAHAAEDCLNAIAGALK